MPNKDCTCETEAAYAEYFDCSLHRRYAAYKGKPALTDAEIKEWQVLYENCCGIPPPWQDDPDLEDIATFLKAHGHLPGLQSGQFRMATEEKCLAQMLRLIVQARTRDVPMHHRNGTISVKRAQLSNTELLWWEAVLGGDIWRQATHQVEYVPGHDIFDEQYQINSSDTDYTCTRCGYGAQTEVQILRHVVRSHSLPSH